MNVKFLNEALTPTFESNSGWKDAVNNYITYEKGWEFFPSTQDTRKSSKNYNYSLKLLDGDWGNYYLNNNTGVAVISCSAHQVVPKTKHGDPSQRAIFFLVLIRKSWKWKMTVPYFIYSDRGWKKKSPVEEYIPSACSYARKFIRQLSIMPDAKVTKDFLVGKLKQVSKATSKFQLR